ncbi:hypothetical protein EDEG_02944 [Edhazardia aedis USNM 41457]|uniref:Bromo domain-containing protein n=1 Tax=Edhazardia aedis (strain USNM 41457) TaxID=1003232 RepID=J9D4E1_EDHAE|nr:hypothetical protein EDEG_02944 [Edhazardia aedis USNM 41457]|eukprot:EJW02661.1 hypothetical protein EDEG_02944 [Edhazardia aedis USNM 41457]
MSDTLEQQWKYCDEVIVKIMGNRNAGPFLEPVDPIKLNIPDYPEKIKHPMDLSTIQGKLTQRIYKTIDAFKDDYKLMINNCFTYNAKGTGVYKAGAELEKAFNNLMNKMPSEEAPKRRKTESTKSVEKVKRVATGSISQEDQRTCEEIINELLKPKHSLIVWPFLDPITDEIVPGYSKVIKHPTDLSTIKSKIADKVYDSKEDCYKELKTMVANCFKYNAEVKKIYDCGLELDKMIDTLFTKHKSTKDEIIAKIVDLKNKINVLNNELKIYEERLTDEERKNIVYDREYTLDERLELGNQITELNQIQTTKIAHIISKTGIHLDFVGRNEVEMDLRSLPDKCIGEIKDYLDSIKASKG